MTGVFDKRQITSTWLKARGLHPHNAASQKAHHAVRWPNDHWDQQFKSITIASDRECNAHETGG